MTIFDLFSKRQKRLRGEMPDVYQYTELPQEFRVQVAHIVRDVFGDPQGYGSQTTEAFKFIHDTLSREYGMFSLSEHHDAHSGLLDFFLKARDVERALDVIEVSFRMAVYCHGQRSFIDHSKPKMTATDAIEELNARFREHGIGYQFESGDIIRVDSQVVHEEVVKPTLHLLKARRFAGANDEFLKAHEHYRHARHGEAVNECLKALESVLKVICQTQNWPYKETDTAKALLDIVFAHHLVPAFLQSEFAGLRSVLESGVPTTRSRTSAHGAGSQPRSVPPHIASYALHLTASSILFLVEAEKHLA